MIYNLSSIFKSTDLTSFYFANISKIILGSSKFKEIPLTSENATSEELEIFTKFTSAIGLKIADINNFGIVRFDKMQKVGHAPAFFCLNSDGEMGLSVGSNKPEHDLVSTFVPATFENRQYQINGKNLELIERLDKDDLPTGKVYLSLKISARDSFTFPVVIDNKVKGDADVIFENWENGTFINCVAEGGKGGGSLTFGKIQHLFRSAFTNKQFPDTGICLLLDEGSYTYSDKSANYEKGFELSNWKVVATSHPDFLVDVEVDKVISSGYLLSDIAYISFPKSGQPTKFFHNIQGGTVNDKGALKRTHSGRVLLWVTGVNSYTKNIEHIPAHAFVSDSKNFDFFDFSEYPEFAAIINNGLESEARESLPQPYPVSAEKVRKNTAPGKKKVSTPIVVTAGEMEESEIPF